MLVFGWGESIILILSTLRLPTPNGARTQSARPQSSQHSPCAAFGRLEHTVTPCPLSLSALLRCPLKCQPSTGDVHVSLLTIPDWSETRSGSVRESERCFFYGSAATGIASARGPKGPTGLTGREPPLLRTALPLLLPLRPPRPAARPLRGHHRHVARSALALRIVLSACIARLPFLIIVVVFV